MSAIVLTPEMAETEPMNVVLHALTMQAKGESLTEYEQEVCQYAGTLLAASQLVKAGMDPDAVFRNFDERDYTLRFKWTRSTDEVEVIVEWDDEGDENGSDAEAPR